MIHSLIAVALVALSALAVATFPRSVLVFLLFQGSLLFVYKARIPQRLRWGLLAIGLLVLMPAIGYFNSYYLEVATQVGIFVALALGLAIQALPGTVALAVETRDAARARGVRHPRAFLTPFVIRVVARAHETGDALHARGIGDD